MNTLVVKLGGSILFSQGGLQRFSRWWESRPETACAMIVGGGETVESMRILNRHEAFDQEAMHWRCIRLMDATLECVSEKFPEFPVVSHSTQFTSLQNEMENWLKGKGPSKTTKQIWLVRVGAFHHPDARDGLPRGWSVTSDSLAWVLAKKLSIARICLLKSCTVPSTASMMELASLGVVDEYFPSLCDGSLTVELCTI